MNRFAPLLLGLLLVLPIQGFAQDAGEIAKKAHLAAYYAGEDGVAQLLMQVYRKGSDEPIKKLFFMLRMDLEEGGRQMFYTYFTAPSDIRRTTFLVHKYLDKDDFRRLYLPASDKVLAISGARKQDPFMGSDFSYEDVSGRHWSMDSHKLLAEETLNDKPMYVVESTPIEREERLARSRFWIDKETFLPMKVEFYDHEGRIYKVYETGKVAVVEGYPTIMVRTMTSPLEGTRTVILVNPKNLRYDVGLDESAFSERALKNPPTAYFN